MKINRETKIGIMVTIAIAMLIWGINFLKGRNILSNQQTFYAVYQKIDGLSEAAPVTVNGYNVGNVSGIELNQQKDNALVVTMELKKDLRLPLETIAQIKSTGVIGGMAVVLVMPENVEGYHSSQDTLLSNYKEGIDAVLDDAGNTVDELMMSLESILVSLNEILNAQTQKQLSGIFQNLENITDKLEVKLSAGGELDETMGHLETFTGTMADNADNLTQISSNLATFTDSLSHLEMNETVNELNDVLVQTQRLLETVNSAEGTAGKLVNDDSLYTNLNEVTVSLNDLLIDLKENPKKYVQFSLIERKQKED